jgi:hypothetical protein
MKASYGLPIVDCRLPIADANRQNTKSLDRQITKSSGPLLISRGTDFDFLTFHT